MESQFGEGYTDKNHLALNRFSQRNRISLVKITALRSFNVVALLVVVGQSFTWSTFEFKLWSNNSAPGPSVQRRAPKPTEALAERLAAAKRVRGRSLASQVRQSAPVLPGFLYDTHWSCRLKVILSFQHSLLVSFGGNEFLYLGIT